jgi:hypothetical protein
MAVTGTVSCIVRPHHYRRRTNMIHSLVWHIRAGHWDRFRVEGHRIMTGKELRGPLRHIVICTKARLHVGFVIVPLRLGTQKWLLVVAERMCPRVILVRTSSSRLEEQRLWVGVRGRISSVVFEICRRTRYIFEVIAGSCRRKWRLRCRFSRKARYVVEMLVVPWRWLILLMILEERRNPISSVMFEICRRYRYIFDMIVAPCRRKVALSLLC